jgi:beta-glucanase (GH16 family)
MKILMQKLLVLVLATGTILWLGCPGNPNNPSSQGLQIKMVELDPDEDEPTPRDPPYTHPDLVWNDEFNGDTLNMANWNYDYGHGHQYGNGGWGNGEPQYYTPDNVYVKDGKLHLEARVVKPNQFNRYPGIGPQTDPVQGQYSFTSGKILSAGTINLDYTNEPLKFAVSGGHRVEASMKLPAGRCFWPAFWMLGINGGKHNSSARPTVGWPLCGEIDIMEARGHEPYKYGVTVHCGLDYYDGWWYRGADCEHGEKLTENFYIYGVRWDDEDITYYLRDPKTGEQLFQWSLNFEAQKIEELGNGNINNGLPTTFLKDKDFFIIFNLALGGNYTGWEIANPNDPVFGDTEQNLRDRTLQVDWVRVYRYPGTVEEDY